MDGVQERRTKTWGGKRDEEILPREDEVYMEINCASRGGRG